MKARNTPRSVCLLGKPNMSETDILCQDKKCLKRKFISLRGNARWFSIGSSDQRVSA